MSRPQQPRRTGPGGIRPLVLCAQGPDRGRWLAGWSRGPDERHAAGTAYDSWEAAARQAVRIAASRRAYWNTWGR